MERELPVNCAFYFLHAVPIVLYSCVLIVNLIESKVVNMYNKAILQSQIQCMNEHARATEYL